MDAPSCEEISSDSSDDLTVVSSASSSGASLGPLGDIPLRLSVRSALKGSFFRVVNADRQQIIEEISQTNRIEAICLNCDEGMSNKTKIVKVNVLNISNLITHLQRHHDRAIVESFKKSIVEDRKAFVAANPNRSYETRLKKDTNDHKKTHFDNLIVDYVVQAMVPLQSVDHPTFKRIFEFLNIEKTGVKLMSRRRLGRLLDSRFVKHIDQIKNQLKEVTWVCTSTDIWSGGKRSFLGVTAHWINDKLERESAALSCKRIKGTHSYDKIASQLDEIHRRFGLTHEKVLATVTDNGSNFVKAFKIYNVQEEIGEEDEENEEENWVALTEETTLKLPHHLRCAAHTLALCASTDVMRAIECNEELSIIHSAVMKKCRTLWSLTNRPKSAEIINDLTKKCLPTPSVTRWNSLYDSLVALIKIKSRLGDLWRLLNLNNPFEETEIAYLEELVRCSEPVASAIDILQGEHKAYYGSLIPTLLALEKKLLKLTQNRWRFCEPIAETYHSSVKQRFSQFFNLETQDAMNAGIAALSYPKFKKSWFPCISTEKQDILISHFKEIVYEMLASESVDNDEPMDIEECAVEDFFDFGEEETSRPSLNTDLDFRARTAIEQFFLDRKTNIDMLNNYPIIKTVFKKYNTPLPSSAQVERLFSYATMVNTPKSNRLSDEKFEIRVIMKANSSIGS